jgi:hypothetical protein
MVLSVSSQAEVGEPFDDGRHRFPAPRSAAVPGVGDELSGEPISLVTRDSAPEVPVPARKVAAGPAHRGDTRDQCGPWPAAAVSSRPIAALPGRSSTVAVSVG